MELSYNTKYVCSYNDSDVFLESEIKILNEHEKQFVRDALYRRDLCNIFNIKPKFAILSIFLFLIFISVFANGQNEIPTNVTYIKCTDFQITKPMMEYEPVNENDIIVGCKNVPTIWYTTNDGVKHRHYVDIFIPIQNRCIEVKGEWFYKRDKQILKLKKQEAEKLGYKYDWFWYQYQLRFLFVCLLHLKV